ncbi:MAG: hypothetical protein HY898_29080 [Deltaproteobacteria bacterium]|nr:hypothetical protein [Deltaproteobacteria bacterium]
MRTRPIIALASCLFCLASLAGCGSSSSGDPGGGAAGTGGSDGGPLPDSSVDATDAMHFDAPDTSKPDVVDASGGDADAPADSPADATEEEAAAPSCTDLLKNGNETDTDCGGDTCPKCADTLKCAVASDCQSAVCQAGSCQAASCADQIKNASETDIDCGGNVCPKCADLMVCLVAGDCVSGVCQAGKCSPAECVDGVKNGAETDIDCGGGACPPCVDLKKCLVASDCVSVVCEAGACKKATCTDLVKNGLETSIDCGGTQCPKCADLEPCLVGTDCSSGVCDQGQCQPGTCTDTVKNGAETDMDCGGGTCPPCADQLKCIAGSDCQSGVCWAGKCKVPVCNDGVKNGAESDVDCGGGACVKCNDLKICNVADDCKSGVCTGNQCQAPSCNDGVKNGQETDADCGGPCSPCADLKTCAVPADCQSGVCTNGVCQAPACNDGLQNGSESDTDCGGTACPGCADGKKCTGPKDCAASACFSGICGQYAWTTESKGTNVAIPGNQVWVDVTSMGLAPVLPKAATVLLRWTGTLRWSSGGNGLCHVGQRFMIDGQPTGHVTWGDAIMVQEGGTRWHEFFTVELAVPLAAGAHYISPQMTNASGYGTCNLDGDGGLPYDRSRFAIQAYEPGEAWYAESTGETGALGSTSAWVDIPGANLSMALPGDRHVQFSVQGTQYATGTAQAHCAYRFVLDGAPLGDPNHGQAIVVGDVDQGWWEPVTIKYGAPLTAGNHTIKVQTRNSGAAGGSCNAAGNNLPYSRFHLFAAASATGGATQSFESTGGSQVLGSNSAWTAVAGLNGSFNLAAPGHVQFEVSGTQRTVSGSGHCAYRFVVDGTPLGDANHGQAINVGEGAETWWTPMGLLWGQDFTAGAHTVRVDLRNSSTSGDCGLNGDGAGYGRARMLVRGP